MTRITTRNTGKGSTIYSAVFGTLVKITVVAVPYNYNHPESTTIFKNALV